MDYLKALRKIKKEKEKAKMQRMSTLKTIKKRTINTNKEDLDSVESDPAGASCSD